MKKKFKPVPLDVDVITPQPPVRDPQVTLKVNERYGSILSSVGVNPSPLPTFRFKGRDVLPLEVPTGLAEIPIGGVPPVGSGSTELKEGEMVYIKRHGKIFVDDDARFTWKTKMSEVASQGDPGEVKLVDDDSVQVDFEGAVMWFPSCALLPCVLPGSFRNVSVGYLTMEMTYGEVGKGTLVVLRPNSKTLIAASPFHHDFLTLSKHKKIGVITDTRRRVKPACRVQFGGYLWSLPMSSISRDPDCGGEGTYLAAYSMACHRHSCRPNTELLKLLTTGPVTRIDLSNNYLGKKGLLCLAEVLCINTTITDLSLPNNALCHESVATVLDVLRKDKLIKTIDLSGNQFSYLTGRGIKQLVSLNTNITSIRLDSTGIPDWMVKEITQQVGRNSELGELKRVNLSQ